MSELATTPAPGCPQAPLPIADACRVNVLASGSAGNCTVIQTTVNGRRTTLLIDLGLSPRRTVNELAALGLTLADIDAVLMTHLDVDHCHTGWSPSAGKEPRLPPTTRVHMAKSHVGRAVRAMFNGGRVEPFRGDFQTAAGVRVSPTMIKHDALGTAAFRITLANGTLGFATDVGRASEALIEHLRHVDVLAIESNYCPAMQAASNRPAQLKARITGGSGHLSNQQALEAVQRIKPKSAVVLLHLSRECNRPELVAELHAGSTYGLTISSQTAASGWVRVMGDGTHASGTAVDARSAAHAPLFAEVMARDATISRA